MNRFRLMNPQSWLSSSATFSVSASPQLADSSTASPAVTAAADRADGQTASPVTPDRQGAKPWFLHQPLQKLRGGLLMGVGYLLSPLCWWNDLIINLPVAYGFGYLVSLVVPEWFGVGAIAGYWLSNLVGIVLMQWGLGDMVQGQGQRRQPTRDLLMGLATSTLYTVVIVAVVQLKWLDLSAILPSDLFATSSVEAIASGSTLSLAQLGTWLQQILHSI